MTPTPKTGAIRLMTTPFEATIKVQERNGAATTPDWEMPPPPWEQANPIQLV
ncbi:MAG: hypothetical protein WCP32_02165 [Bacteroidota bacterium]